MEYTAPLETYSGSVKEVVIGKGDRSVKVGGENILPLHYFEGKAANRPKIALEIDDNGAAGWSEWVLEPYKDVVADPVKWALKCLDLGADLICLRLESTDPQGANVPAEIAAALVKKVAAEVQTALVVYGCGDDKKDAEVLAAVAAACSGENLLIGPAVKENYEPLAKAVAEHGHCIIAQTPIDINLEKELNVKLLKQLPPERIVIDPLSSALGYGMEYSFTIMERTKQVGVIHGDFAMQIPIIADLGGECWKTNQARAGREQGILWEGITAMSLLLAGANLLVLRHPNNCRMIKEAIDGKL
ncbi:MAG: acetyl-CoA decarbonylase/synthase complex subunit delta [Dehalococcoidia bacterium]|nr:acetyl-CoA decarbonylase/synthase complex subunit delta [Dehalococcoidia bacterium]MDD5494515.1 acetyl-CoA decarbonylase/synthase complex subunit delta [Dehalococcoidia bacterium]